MEDSTPTVAHPVLDHDPLSEWLGLHLVEWAPGHAVLEMTVREDQLNGFGIAHGGVIFSLAETALLTGCNDPAGEGSEVSLVSGAEIAFVRQVHLGERLRARVDVVNPGRSGLYDVRIALIDADGSDGATVAEIRGRSRTLGGDAVPHPRRLGPPAGNA